MTYRNLNRRVSRCNTCQSWVRNKARRKQAHDRWHDLAAIVRQTRAR